MLDVIKVATGVAYGRNYGRNHVQCYKTFLRPYAMPPVLDVIKVIYAARRVGLTPLAVA